MGHRLIRESAGSRIKCLSSTKSSCKPSISAPWQTSLDIYETLSEPLRVLPRLGILHRVLPGPPFIEGLKIIQIEMSQACTRCYANPEERAAFQKELQALAKRENRGYLAADRNGMPLFQEKIRARADGTGFEFQGMARAVAYRAAGPGRGDSFASPVCC